VFYFKTSFVFKGDGRCETLQQNLLGETRNQTYCVVRVCELNQNAESKRRIENWENLKIRLRPRKADSKIKKRI